MVQKPVIDLDELISRGQKAAEQLSDPSTADLDRVEDEKQIALETPETPLAGLPETLPVLTPTQPEIVAVLPEEPAKAPIQVSPETEKRMREMAKKTLVPRPSYHGFRELPDGSLRGQVTISVESAEVLKAWAESAGEPLEEYIPKTLNEALLAYCSGAGV